MRRARCIWRRVQSAKERSYSGLERSDKNDGHVVPTAQSAPVQQQIDQEEHDRLMAWLRAQQSSLPKCAEGYTRLAPTPPKR